MCTVEKVTVEMYDVSKNCSTPGKGPTVGKVKNHAPEQKGTNCAFMKMNEGYSTIFNALIATKEASMRRFKSFMMPSI